MWSSLLFVNAVKEETGLTSRLDVADTFLNKQWDGTLGCDHIDQRHTKVVTLQWFRGGLARL